MATLADRAVESSEVEIGIVRSSGPEAPRLPRNRPFLLAYHPKRWCLLRHSGGLRCVPALAQVQLIAGAGGVEVRGGKVDPTAKLATLRRKGWHVLEQSRDYLRSVDVRGGKHYLLRWATPFEGDDILDVDLDGYVEWLEGLDLPAPRIATLRAMVRGLEREQVQLRDQARTRPSAVDRLAENEAQVAAIRSKIKQLEPKKRAARTKPVES